MNRLDYLRSWNGFERFLRAHLLHGTVILLLILRHEHLQGSAGFLLLFVEIIDDDSNEEIEREERAEDDEENKVKVHVDVDFLFGLLIHLKCNMIVTVTFPWVVLIQVLFFFLYLSRIRGVLHDLHPPFESGHLEQGQVGLANVVKVHRRILPRVIVSVGQLFALRFILHEFHGHHLAFRIHALRLGSKCQSLKAIMN